MKVNQLFYNSRLNFFSEKYAIILPFAIIASIIQNITWTWISSLPARVFYSLIVLRALFFFLNSSLSKFLLLKLPQIFTHFLQLIKLFISCPFFLQDQFCMSQYFWPPHAQSWLIGKDSEAGRDWGQEEKGDDRGWDGWMASLTRWTWVWVNSGSWWWTRRPGVLRFMESQRVGQDWAIELNWTEVPSSIFSCYIEYNYFVHSSSHFSKT